jgi:serine/threonine protein kinase
VSEKKIAKCHEFSDMFVDIMVELFMMMYKRMDPTGMKFLFYEFASDKIFLCSEPQAARVLKQMLEALQYMHKEGIAHR